MKKAYLAPEAEVLHIVAEQMVCDSMEVFTDPITKGEDIEKAIKGNLLGDEDILNTNFWMEGLPIF